METNTTYSLLIDLISQETGVSVEQISETTKLEDLGIDSLDFVDLMQAISEKFKPIAQEKYAEVNTVGDLLKLI